MDDTEHPSGQESTDPARMHGQTAVVTGGASGIGLALARHLAGSGARVVVADLDAEGARAVARDLGGTAVVTDVARPIDNEELAEIAGPARLVCLNAGVTGPHPGPVWSTPPEEWAHVISTNLGGVVNGLRAFVPRLLADGEPHHILITASLAGLATWPGGGAYAASKHAVVTVAEQAAIDLAGSRVSVTVLCPALVRSAMSPHGADPADIAAEALAAVVAGRFAVVPAAWSRVVIERGHRLATGKAPQVPALT